MIDTVILHLRYPDFNILECHRFVPDCAGFFFMPYTPFNGQSYLKSTQNPSRQDKEQGNYKPRLTLIKRIGRKHNSFRIDLKIEFSCPKLLCGNNFQEFAEESFEALLATLHRKLNGEMGVQVTVESLRNAELATVHYSKNFLLTDYSTAESIICDIRKVNLSNRLDLNKTDFRNEGMALYYYSKTNSLIFYDKVKDLEQPQGRGMESDNEYNLQPTLFEYARRVELKPIEVLRMEARLCDKRKLAALLKRLNIEAEPTFAGLYRSSIAKAVLLHYWDMVYMEARRNALISRNTMDLLDQVLKVPEGNLQKKLGLFGLLTLLKDESERAIESKISKHYHPRTYTRMKHYLRTYGNVIYDRHTVFDAIYRQLCEFNMVTNIDIDI